MNITFVLGNGFDIQLGLSTRYSDFLREYVHITPENNDNIKEFKSYLAQKTTKELWSDAEKAMGIYLGQYSDTTIEIFNERVRDFERSMVVYLNQQQEQCFYSDKKQIATRFKDFIFKTFHDALTCRRNDLDVNLNAPNFYRFITFNYTNLLEKIKECCISENAILRKRVFNGITYNDFWGPTIHVHGTLNTQIIMGVNDESQLELGGGTTLTEALRWELIKPALNNDSGYNFDLPAKNEISNSDIIAIYGVSYGDTDKLWWQEIVNWLRQNSGHKLVAFTRDEPGQFVPTLAWTELNYEKNKRREILKKLHVEENSPDFEALIEQIYIVLNTTRLNLKEILLPEITNDTNIAASTNPHEPTAI